MVEHLMAWARCSLIPMYSSRNKKAFEGCNFRPDIVWELPDITVMLECDQDAHRDYDKDKETERMEDLMAAARGKAVMIRFNPSLAGTTMPFKYTTLMVILADVFLRKDKYTVTGMSLIYVLYPNKPFIWYPASSLDGVVAGKRMRVEPDIEEQD